ncbi:MAG TPA: hypothetical protein VHV79_05530 [Mycobacteriales bacterium]|nr:hypothetical protein [Mycobacteriales bacterium]
MSRSRSNRTVAANRVAPTAAPIASPEQICCGQRLRRIDIRSVDSMLSFNFCGRCESMRWFKDGLPTDDESLVGALRATTVEPRAAGR